MCIYSGGSGKQKILLIYMSPLVSYCSINCNKYTPVNYNIQFNYIIQLHFNCITIQLQLITLFNLINYNNYTSNGNPRGDDITTNKFLQRMCGPPNSLICCCFASISTVLISLSNLFIFFYRDDHFAMK